MNKTNKVTDKKTQAIRVDQWEIEYIIAKGRGKSFNESMQDILSAFRGIEAQGIAELQGYFTEKEWVYMANVLKVTPLIWSKEELILRLTDTKDSVAFAPLFDINQGELARKINALGAHHVIAIVERVTAFWTTDNVEMKVWSQY